MFHVPPKRHHIMSASTSIGGRWARRRQQRGDATKPAVAKSGIQSAYDNADEDEDHDRNPAAKPAVAKSAVNSSGDFAVVDQDHDRKPAAKPAVAKGWRNLAYALTYFQPNIRTAGRCRRTPGSASRRASPIARRRIKSWPSIIAGGSTTGHEERP